MSTLISVYAVRFNASEVFGDREADPEAILGLASTVIQALNNRMMPTVAIGMADDGNITLVFGRQNEAGRALYVLAAVIDVLKGEREAWNEGHSVPDDQTLN